MLDDNVKIQKMVEIAKMYYEENLTQNDIAKRLGVSQIGRASCRERV